MSEAVRNYSTGRTGYAAPSSRGGLIRLVLLGALIIGFSWLFWTTRDTYPVERLVPRDQTFHLQAEQLLSSRSKAASSPLWELGLLPEKYRAIPEWLGNDFGLPDWVLNNLVSDVCYVSGKDFKAFSDLLVVTRMSRVGCLIERYHRFMDGIEDEPAGGLHLRRMANSNTYYAVRGRTLVFSPSRDALIASLSQREESSVESLEDAISATGGDVQGRVSLHEEDPLGQYFERADFVLTFAPDSIAFACRGIVRSEWRSGLDALARGGRPSSIPDPGAGAVVAAGNFGAPLPEVYRAVDQVLGGAVGTYVRSHPAIAAIPAGDQAGWPLLAEGISNVLGASFAIRWMGFDHDGAVPLPVLELTLPSSGSGIPTLLAATPPLESGRMPVDGMPYRDAESGVVHVPIGWGGILEPAIEPISAGARIALHPAHLLAYPAEPPGEPLGSDGQFFMRVRPAEALTLIWEGGIPYADAGLIHGHTLDSFEAAMAAAIGGVQQVEEARLTANYDSGALSIEIVIDIGAPPVEPE